MCGQPPVPASVEVFHILLPLVTSNVDLPPDASKPGGFVKWTCPVSGDSLSSTNCWTFKHSSRGRPFKDSMCPFSVKRLQIRMRVPRRKHICVHRGPVLLEPRPAVGDLTYAQTQRGLISSNAFAIPTPV